MRYSRTLAIETSCDDTSVAIVRADGFVEAMSSANQDQVHAPFGGVVPEVAGRNHSLYILPLIQKTLEKANLQWGDIPCLSVTSRPGLMGSLLVGVVTAKTLALSKGIPFLGINHLEGHLLAPFLKDRDYAPPENFQYPYLALAVSGGHTQLYRVKDVGLYEILGHTIDDAAGEAFDKFAKALGLGFPGGVAVDKMSQGGNEKAFSFPRPMIYEDNYLFSFSGLKAAALRLLETMSEEEQKNHAQDLSASYQKAIVDSLLSKLNKAVEKTGLRRVVLTGGVSANSCLRKNAEAWANEKKLQLVLPPLRYCTDNAAMVGYAGILRLNRGELSEQDLAPQPRSFKTDFIYSVEGLTFSPKLREREVKQQLYESCRDGGEMLKSEMGEGVLSSKTKGVPQHKGVPEIKEFLEKIGASPKMSLGQNFLTSPHIISKIINRVEQMGGDQIIEVGPGLGALTYPLQSLGKPLKLLELDAKFCQSWRDQDYEVYEGDALQFEWENLLQKSSVLVSNLPYQISSSLVIDRSLGNTHLQNMILMFQKEVAQRIMAQHGSKNYGVLSIIAQSFWDVELLLEASPKDFYPSPKVASRVLVFHRKSFQMDHAKGFKDFVKLSFSQRRKFLQKNICRHEFGFEFSSPQVAEAFSQLKISPQARAEDLSVEQFQNLFRELLRRASPNGHL